jgi:hypothetical protein
MSRPDESRVVKMQAPLGAHCHGCGEKHERNSVVAVCKSCWQRLCSLCGKKHSHGVST